MPRLLQHGIGDFADAVADKIHRRRSGKIEIALAIGVPDDKRPPRGRPLDTAYETSAATRRSEAASALQWDRTQWGLSSAAYGSVKMCGQPLFQAVDYPEIGEHPKV